jgi:hypothetical protein
MRPGGTCVNTVRYLVGFLHIMSLQALSAVIQSGGIRTKSFVFYDIKAVSGTTRVVYL